MMPFGLKNAGATYQRLVDQVFAEQKGRNMEVYVDDSIVKSKEAKDHVSDLAETFATLRKHQMKLNPKKCVFGVRSGKFLGFMVRKRGIDANPAKVQAALDLLEPKTKRDIQRLTGRMAALSRFISKASDKGLPFFKALKLPKSKELMWEDEQKIAFQQLREQLANLPTLARPAEGEVLYLYVAVSPATIVVLTDQPLEKILGKVEKSGRLTKWAFELTKFSISYQPRAAIKAQALADFLAECSYQETLDEEKGTWTVFTDGSATINGSGAGVVITSPEGKNFEYALKFSFKASNNEAEYEAVVAGLELCIALEAEHVCLKTDSQLVANQIRGEYEAKEPSMISYLAKIKSVIAKLRTFEIELIPRGQNAQADALSKLASSTLTELNRFVYVEVRRNRSIDQEIEVQCVEAEPSWMDSILAYKLQGTLPEDRNLAVKIKRVGPRFIVYNGELLKKSFSAPLLKCVGPTDADYILREIHFGICGNHIRGRTLAHKALRVGYYWPTMIQDAKDLVQKCEKCQKFAPVIHRPSRDLQPILNPLPFAQWGLDILGPFPEAPYQKKWLIIGIDYFSKWIEAEAASNITEQTVRKFIWQNIITRFGIPKVFVFDHGRQFDNLPLRWYTDHFGIKLEYSAVCHPQSNGQAEAANKQILNALKKRVEDQKSKWIEELPRTLWSLRTTEKEATGHSPFELVYESEAVLPVEIGSESLRVNQFSVEENEHLMKESLDFLDEVRDSARDRMAAYKQRISKFYNRRVQTRLLKVGDLVLRNVAAVQKSRIHGKLSANWEGPYELYDELQPGTYRLRQLGGTELKNHWNADVLRKFHV
ncbi:uncharacterized protein LOC110735803 [Chenopodium quinoa]|uniref:uncharacterized protein LOC110735803 n=1 Tax=Chenopodium quinoa TaxID=63459 RepID=UPI000B79054A|nr:uncharacterized protein LOC110735803 [Chenopodium quinoa]